MSGALGVIVKVGEIAAQGNIAVATIFALIRGVRDAWPRNEGEPVLGDDVLIATMDLIFKTNKIENAGWRAQVEALIAAEAAPVVPPTV